MFEVILGEIVVWEVELFDCGWLDVIFCFVYIVKGSCGFFDLLWLGWLSYVVEDVLVVVCDGKWVLDIVLVNVVFLIVDWIVEIVEVIDVGVLLDDLSEDLLIVVLVEDVRFVV